MCHDFQWRFIKFSLILAGPNTIRSIKLKLSIKFVSARKRKRGESCKRT